MADTPLARRRAAGALLKAHRTRLGLKSADVAAQVGVSAAKMSRLESGARGLRVDDAKALCELYQLSGDETNKILALVRESQGRGAWAQAELPDAMRIFFGLEADASSVLSFHPAILPGLLQTETYARALIAGIRPSGMLSDEVQESRLALRMRRKELLLPERKRRFHYVLDEAVLIRWVLPPADMAAQVEALVAASRAENVSLQVVPFRAGVYSGMAGGFTLLQFEDELLGDSVFIEDLSGYAYHEDEAQLVRFRRFFADIAETALGEAESRELLEDIARTWRARGA